ncbi:hypothetical protein [Streptomyces spinosirectus]
MQRVRLVPAVALLVLSPLALTACGSGDPSSSGSGNSGRRQACSAPTGNPSGMPGGAPSAMPGGGQGGAGGGCGGGAGGGRG